MKPMYKTTMAAVCSAVIIFNFSGCKYEDGPAFSLKTKKGRLTGEWKAVKIDNESFDGKLIYEFEKDGGLNYSVAYGYFEFDGSGDWEWDEGKSEIQVEVDGEKTNFEILRLTNKELIFEDEDNTEYEFEKQ